MHGILTRGSFVDWRSGRNARCCELSCPASFEGEEAEGCHQPITTSALHHVFMVLEEKSPSVDITLKETRE